MNVIPVALPSAAYDAIILGVSASDRLIPTIGVPGVQSFLVWPDLDHTDTAIALIRGEDTL